MMRSLYSLLPLNFRRKVLAKKALDNKNLGKKNLGKTNLAEYYQTEFVNLSNDWREVEYLALDFETTGLDFIKDDILSLGYVTVRGPVLHFSTSRYELVKPTQKIPEASAVIHGILDEHINEASQLEPLLLDLLSSLQGKVLIAHHASIEYQFLNKVCLALYNLPFICPVVDTFVLQQRLYKLHGHAMKPGDLRLHACRQYLNLPRYLAHNALTDAVAAAELFLAQATVLSAGRFMSVRQLQHRL